MIMGLKSTEILLTKTDLQNHAIFKIHRAWNFGIELGIAPAVAAGHFLEGMKFNPSWPMKK